MPHPANLYNTPEEADHNIARDTGIISSSFDRLKLQHTSIIEPANSRNQYTARLFPSVPWRGQLHAWIVDRRPMTLLFCNISAAL